MWISKIHIHVQSFKLTSVKTKHKTKVSRTRTNNQGRSQEILATPMLICKPRGRRHALFGDSYADKTRMQAGKSLNSDNSNNSPDS